MNSVCSNTAASVTQRRDNPCRRNVAGPKRNSPLPIEPPRTMTPGPTTPNQSKPLGLGGAGKSARVHPSSPERASIGVNLRDAVPVDNQLLSSSNRKLRDY